MGLTQNAFCQTRYLTKTVDVIIPTVLDLTITSGGSQLANFDQTSKLDNGIEYLNATTLTYKSNLAWFVSVKAGSANFSGGPAGNSMPASVIQFRKNPGGTYTPLSTIDAPLSGTTGSKNARGTGTINVDFKINPGYIYAPAQDYSIQIIYTISNQ